MKTYSKHGIFILTEKLPNIKATPTEIKLSIKNSKL